MKKVTTKVPTWHRTGECELEEPIFKTDGIILHEKTTSSNEGGFIRAIQITTVGKGVSDRPEGQSTTRTVQ